MTWFKKRKKYSLEDPKEISTRLGRNQEHAVDSAQWQVVIRMPEASFAALDPVSQECTFSARATILFLMLGSIEEGTQKTSGKSKIKTESTGRVKILTCTR